MARMVYGRSRLPWLFGLAAAVVVAPVAWVVARPEAASLESAGLVATAPYKFIAFFTLFAAAVAFLVARRILDGAATRQDEWSLHVAGAPQVRVGELEARLVQHGYQLRLVILDDGGVAQGAPAKDQPLLGTPLWITEKRASGRMAGIVLRVARPQPGEEGLGLVEIRDTRGLYDELGQYLLVALGQLMPGLRVRRLVSSETAEDPAALAAMLPERPQFLPQR
jgi:hypothetical protein